MSIQDLTDKLQRHLAYLEQDKNNINLLLSVGLLQANILHHQHRVLDAITLLDDLALNHGLNAEIAGLLALLHLDNNDTVQAAVFARQALSFDPSNYQGQLVHLLLRTLRQEVTLAEIEALIAISPNDCRLWFALGTTHMRHMNILAAEQAFINASKLWPSFYDNWICLGWCHLLQNHLESAHAAYIEAVQLDSDGADGWGGLALVSALKNRIDESNEYLEKANALESKGFLTAVTQIILAYPSSPEKAAQHFNAAFPAVAPEMNRMLASAILGADAKDRILH